MGEVRGPPMSASLLPITMDLTCIVAVALDFLAKMKMRRLCVVLVLVN